MQDLPAARVNYAFLDVLNENRMEIIRQVI